MAKKSFAWNFPRPKQWQKKAWLKFSSTRKRRAYVARVTLEWLEALMRERGIGGDFKSAGIGAMASHARGDGRPAMP
jgi:hypothetical protein